MNNNIVLLHGWGGSKKSLEKLDKELSQFGFETFRLEMPGHGETAEMNTPWEMKNFAKWAEKEISKLNIENYILVGHSFGGKIILESLKQNKLNPQKIILIDINGIKAKNSFKKSFWKFISKVSKAFEKLPGYNTLRNSTYKYVIRERDYLNTKNNIKESFKLFNEQNYDDFIDKIMLPTLIIWGSKDKVTPLWMGKFLHQKIKNSKLIVIEDTHGLPIKQPKKVANAILEFLQN